jgi:hypothetical protein
MCYKGYGKSFWRAGCYLRTPQQAATMNGKNLFNFGPVLGYYFRKHDPNRKNNFNMKTMHFINKLSLAMFLVCLVVMFVRYVL